MIFEVHKAFIKIKYVAILKKIIIITLYLDRVALKSIEKLKLVALELKYIT